MITEPTDHSGMEILDSNECFRLLESTSIGRVAYVADGAPRIFPVTFAVSGSRVVFRSAVGSKLDAAEMGRAVAFEADSWNRSDRSGWSVVAVGRAGRVNDEERLAELEAMSVETWLDAPEMTWVEITIEELSGRRLP